MTEEKTLFKDWKNKNKYKIENVVITLLNYEKGVDTKTCYDEVDWLIQKAFLAGLKAGKPKWHKVADGDYPPCEKGYYTVNVLTNYGDIAYYDYNDGCWIAEPSSVEIDPPIAWCEIPKYTKE